MIEVAENIKAGNKLDKENAIATAQQMAKNMQALRLEARKKEFQSFWQNYLNKLKNKTVTDEQGREMKVWDRVLFEVNKAFHAEQGTYNDWRSGMMSLLSMLLSLVAAMSHSLEESLAENEQIKAFSSSLRIGFGTLKDTIADKIRGEIRVDLPVLKHRVSMSKDNRLDIDKLKYSDNKSAPQLNDLFKVLVSYWLAEQGYERGTEEGAYVQIKGKSLLTKEKFDLLNRDENSLDAYLETYAGTKFEAVIPVSTP